MINIHDASGNVRVRSGFAAIYVAIALVVLLGFVALGVDIGHVHVARSQLQVAADAAARAAVWSIPRQDFAGGMTRAKSVAQANEVAGDGVVLDETHSPTPDIQYGIWRRSTRTFEPLAAAYRVRANAVRVIARRVDGDANAAIQPVDLYFAPVVGHDSMDVTAASIAMIRGLAAGKGTGIVGIDGIEMNGITQTDSYNAAAGAYGATVNGQINLHDYGTVATNNDIRLVGTLTIHGSAHAGPMTDDIIDANSNVTITGSQAPMEGDMYFPPAQAPAAGAYNNAPIAGLLDDGSLRLTGKNKDPVPIPGGTYFIDDFIMTGKTAISVTGPTTIYVSGSVDLTGSITVNQGLPANLQIIVLGAGPVELGGGSQQYAHVYAPLAPVKIHGTSAQFGFFGTVIGKTLTVLGNSAIHYDESNGAGPTDADLWAELVQ